MLLHCFHLHPLVFYFTLSGVQICSLSLMNYLHLRLSTICTTCIYFTKCTSTFIYLFLPICFCLRSAKPWSNNTPVFHCAFKSSQSMLLSSDQRAYSLLSLSLMCQETSLQVNSPQEHLVSAVRCITADCSHSQVVKCWRFVTPLGLSYRHKRYLRCVWEAPGFQLTPM